VHSDGVEKDMIVFVLVTRWIFGVDFDFFSSNELDRNG
jgi:hypothetical protein